MPTYAQLITYPYLIFQKSDTFMDCLKLWNVKPVGDTTFINLKEHMRQEYLALQEVGGLAINSSTMNHVSLVQELKTHQTA